MSLSTYQLREEFKKHLHWCESVLGENSSLSHHDRSFDQEDEYLKSEMADHIYKMQAWSEFFERSIESKIRSFEKELQKYELSGEYLRSITEGLDDLDRLRRIHKTLSDVVIAPDKTMLLANIKKYYHNFFIPLLNILAKLDNDYQAILTSKKLQTPTNDSMHETITHSQAPKNTRF